MRIVITGASGNFGRTVTKKLLAAGHAATDLILVSRSPEKLDDFLAQGCDVRKGDFDDGENLVEAFQGGDRILFISTNRVGQREPQHRNAVEAIRAAGIKHVVYTSFIGREGNASLVTHDHRFTENLIKDAGVTWTFLRNSQYADAMRDGAGPACIQSGRFPSAAADGRIALVARDDCIDCAAEVLSSSGHENRIYQITGPELLSYRDLCRMFAEISGRDITYDPKDEEGMYAIFDSIGVPRSAVDDLIVDGFGWCSDDMVSFDLTVAAGDFAILTDDVRLLTGRQPRDVRGFLEEKREDFRKLAVKAREQIQA